MIELITSTIKPDSWDDVGGPGAIDEFRGGVYVDSAGLLRKLAPSTDARSFAVHRGAGLEATAGNNRAAPRLCEKSRSHAWSEKCNCFTLKGAVPSETMQTLAGLQRIKYILVYPQTGDIVLAGPAGDWRRDAEGRFVAADSPAPVLNLDDLVVTLRNAYSDRGRFGCSITPRKDNLAAAKAVNEKWSKQPLKTGQREKWLGELRAPSVARTSRWMASIGGHMSAACSLKPTTG